MRSDWLAGFLNGGATGRCPLGFIVTNIMPLFTSPPPKPPTAPKYFSISGRAARASSTRRMAASVTSSEVPRAVCTRIKNRL